MLHYPLEINELNHAALLLEKEIHDDQGSVLSHNLNESLGLQDELFPEARNKNHHHHPEGNEMENLNYDEPHEFNETDEILTNNVWVFD